LPITIENYQKQKTAILKFDCDWLIYYWSREDRRKRVGDFSHSEEARFRSPSISSVEDVGWGVVPVCLSLSREKSRGERKMVRNFYFLFIHLSISHSASQFFILLLFRFRLFARKNLPTALPTTCFKLFDIWWINFLCNISFCLFKWWEWLVRVTDFSD